MLYTADREHHLEREIIPALEKGYTVITDRYFYSTLAYGSLNMSIEWLKHICEGFLEPDLAYYLKVQPRTAVQRIHSGRFETELFEKEKILTGIATTYDQLTTDYPILQSIDGE